MFILVYIIGFAGFVYLCVKVLKVAFSTKDKSLHELAELLKTKYQEHATIERLFYSDHPLPIEQCYLHLALVEEKSLKAQPNNSDSQEIIKESREYFLHEYERIQHIQRKLKPEELLTECRQAQKRIYIEGAAGAGKTTLSQFIAYQWASNHFAWQQYAFIFRIRLRDLTDANYPENKIDLLHVIEKECFKCGYSNALTVSEKHKLDQYLKSKDKKVLFILDGYDELSLENKTIKDLWESIIQSDYDFIITSRPGMQKSDLKTNLNIAVLGFSDEQVKKYIHYFFDPEHTPDVSRDDASHCLQIFRQNTNLWSLAHTPIQLELLCNIWGDEIKQTSDITLTHIYTSMLEQLLKRYEQKRLASGEQKKVRLSDIDVAPLLEKFAVHLEFLGNLAFVGMERSELVIPHKFIEEAYRGLAVKPNDKAVFFLELRNLGLITRDSDGRRIEFIHLTFQEYFAAHYIVSCWKKNISPQGYQSIKDLIAAKKFDPHYEIVWWMMAGLLSNEPKKLSAFFGFLEEEPKDLTGLNLALLQLRCLDECQVRLDKTYKDRILAHLVKWIDDEITYHRWNYFSNYLVLSSGVLKEEPIQKLFENSLNDNRKALNAMKILVRQADISSVQAQQILSLLKGSGEGIRPSIVWILKKQAEYQGLSEALVQHMLPLLKNPTKHIRLSVAQVLVKHAAYQGWSAELIQEIISLLKDPNEDIKYFAMQVLVKHAAHQGWPDEMVHQMLPQILTLLENPDEDFRSSSVRIIVKNATQQRWPKELAKHMLHLLEDPNEKIRYSVVQVLVKHTPHQNRTNVLIRHVFPLLNDPVERIRSSAVRIVVKYAVRQGWPDELVKHVLSLLNDPVERIRSSAVRIVVKYAVHQGWPDKLVELVISLLKDQNVGVRISAVLALIEHVANQSWPDKLVQQMISLFNDPVERVKFSAVKFIVECAAYHGWPEALVQETLPLLTGPDVGVRSDTMWVLVERIARQGLPEALAQRVLLLLKDPVERVMRLSAVRVLVEYAAHQGWSKKLIQHLLPLLEDQDAGVRSYTMWVLVEHVTCKGLPEALAQRVLLLLKDPVERVKFSAVWFLAEYANYQLWPEALIQQMLPQVLPLLKDPVERIRFSAVDILEKCEEHHGLPQALVQQILPQMLTLLGDPVERIRFSAVRVLVEHAAHQGWPKELVQHVLHLLENSKTSYYAIDVLSKLNVLPIDIFQALEANNTSYVLTLINNIPLKALTFSLKKPYDKAQHFPFPRLLLLKCLEQKLPLYFMNNKLFIGQEFQNTFTPLQKDQFVNSFYKIFYKLTGILPEEFSQKNVSFQSFEINAQSLGDNAKEVRTSVNKQAKEKNLLKREEIIIDVDGIAQVINDRISDINLQKILTDLLKEAHEKQGRFNQNSLNNHVFCQLRDAFISKIKSTIQKVSQSEKYTSDEKGVALTLILPDILFPFWRCRPYQKIETAKEAEQNQQKEQQLFWQQQQLRAQSTFLETLTKISVEREPFITAKPKIYFMYAPPLEEYQLRESGVQSFLQGLHDDLTAAGIEVIFDKEDNFSGNSLSIFMQQILTDNCYMMIFGTQSFRHKWFSEKTALQFESELLQLKWLTDLGENRIIANQKTTIIPWVLTGIRETAIPEDILPAKNTTTTVRALYLKSYIEILSSILSVAYSINIKTIETYFSQISVTQVVGSTQNKYESKLLLATANQASLDLVSASESHESKGMEPLPGQFLIAESNTNVQVQPIKKKLLLIDKALIANKTPVELYRYLSNQGYTWRHLLNTHVFNLNLTVETRKTSEAVVKDLIIKRDRLDKDLYLAAVQRLLGDENKASDEQRYFYNRITKNTGPRNDLTGYKLEYYILDILDKQQNDKCVFTVSVIAPGSHDLISDIDTTVEVICHQKAIALPLNLPKEFGELSLSEMDSELVIQAGMVYHFNQLNCEKLGQTSAESRDSNVYIDGFMHALAFPKFDDFVWQDEKQQEKSGIQLVTNKSKKAFYQAQKHQRNVLELAASLLPLRAYYQNRKDEFIRQLGELFAIHPIDKINQASFDTLMKEVIAKTDALYQYQQTQIHTFKTDEAIRAQYVTCCSKGGIALSPASLSHERAEDFEAYVNNTLYAKHILGVAKVRQQLKGMAKALSDEKHELVTLQAKLQELDKEIQSSTKEIAEASNQATKRAFTLSLETDQKARTELYQKTFFPKIKTYVANLQAFAQLQIQQQEALINVQLFALEAYTNYSAPYHIVKWLQSGDASVRIDRRRAALCSALQQMSLQLLHAQHYQALGMEPGQILYRVAKYGQRVADIFFGDTQYWFDDTERPYHETDTVLQRFKAEIIAKTFGENFYDLLNLQIALVKDIKKNDDMPVHEKGHQAMLLCLKRYMKEYKTSSVDSFSQKILDIILTEEKDGLDNWLKVKDILLINTAGKLIVEAYRAKTHRYPKVSGKQLCWGTLFNAMGSNVKDVSASNTVSIRNQQ